MTTPEKSGLAGCVLVVVLVSLVLSAIIGIWAAQSYMEASSFNAVTGKEVTTWQAMWIELRVQEPSK